MRIFQALALILLFSAVLFAGLDISAYSSESAQNESIRLWRSNDIDDSEILRSISALHTGRNSPPPIPDMRSASVPRNVCTLKSRLNLTTIQYFIDTSDARSNAYRNYMLAYSDMLDGDPDGLSGHFSSAIEYEKKSIVGTGDYIEAFDIPEGEEPETSMDRVLALLLAVYGPDLKGFANQVIRNEAFGILFVVVSAPKGFLLNFDDMLQASAFLMRETLDSMMDYYHRIVTATDISHCYTDLYAYQKYYHEENDSASEPTDYALGRMKNYALKDEGDFKCIKNNYSSSYFNSWKCEQTLVDRLKEERALLLNEPWGIAEIGGYETHEAWSFGGFTTCYIAYVRNTVEPVEQALSSYADMDAAILGNLYVDLAMDVCIEPSEITFSQAVPEIGKSFAINVPVKNIGHVDVYNAKAFVYDSKGNLLAASGTKSIPKGSADSDPLNPPNETLSVPIDTSRLSPGTYNLSIIVVSNFSTNDPSYLQFKSGYDFSNADNSYNISVTFSNFPPSRPSAYLDYFDAASAEVSWTENREGDFLKYRVYLIDAGTLNTEGNYSIAQKNSTWLMIANLTPGKAYKAIVSAVDRFNLEANSSALSFTTLPEPALSASNSTITHDSVLLNWTKINNGEFEAYIVRRSIASLQYRCCDGQVQWIYDRDDNIFNVTGLRANTTYNFRLSVRFDGMATRDTASGQISVKTKESSGPTANAGNDVKGRAGVDYLLSWRGSSGGTYPLDDCTWDLNNDGEFERVFDCHDYSDSFKHHENSPGDYVYTLKVNDTKGNEDIDVIYWKIVNPDISVESVEVPAGRLQADAKPIPVTARIRNIADAPLYGGEYLLLFEDNGYTFKTIYGKDMINDSEAVFVANWTPERGMHNLTVELGASTDLNKTNNNKSLEVLIRAWCVPDVAMESMSIWPMPVYQNDNYTVSAIVRVIGDTTAPTVDFRFAEATHVLKRPYMQREKINASLDNMTQGIFSTRNTKSPVVETSPEELTDTGLGEVRKSTLYDEIIRELEKVMGPEALNASLEREGLSKRLLNMTETGKNYMNIEPEYMHAVPVRWWVVPTLAISKNRGTHTMSSYAERSGSEKVEADSESMNNYYPITNYEVLPQIPKRDLIVISIVFRKDDGGPGIHWVQALVEHDGNTESGAFDYDFRLGNSTGPSVFGSGLHAGLTPGSQFFMTYNNRPQNLTEADLNRSFYVICAVVDSMGSVNETNETNNALCSKPIGVPSYNPSVIRNVSDIGNVTDSIKAINTTIISKNNTIIARR